MPNKEVFSFLYTEHKLFFSKAKGNLFFPKSAKELSIFGKNLEVLSVDPYKISLR